MKKLNFIKTGKVWFSLSGVLIVASIVSLFAWGLNLGIDFTGGSLMDVTISGTNVEELRAFTVEQGYTDVRVQSTEAEGYLFRTAGLTEEQHQTLLSVLRSRFVSVEENKFDFVGPSIGSELVRKTITGIVLCLALIMLYVNWAFRKVSKPVASWKYGAVTILAAFHNVLIPTGVFAVLGHFYDVQIDAAFIAAVLTILGYSINDTIVALDRIRENVQNHSTHMLFEDVVNASLHQTLARSINTTVTVLLALLAILFFGGETTKTFVLALTIGVIVSAYASIFIASPLLVVWEKWDAKRQTSM